MTEEQLPQDPITDEETLDTVLDQGLEAMKKVWAIEREMLSRAIVVICNVTELTPEQVIEKLTDGLDGEYEKQAKTVQASANVSRLYVPKKKGLIL